MQRSTAGSTNRCRNCFFALVLGAAVLAGFVSFRAESPQPSAPTSGAAAAEP